MTTILFLLFSGAANAGVVDDYAARHDWACTYGAQTTCGGPDSWFGIDASHTVILCSDGGEPADCGHTWRVNGSDELVALAFESWGAALEGQLGNSDWVVTPQLKNPDAWMATLRDPGTLAALEVGRGYVQVTLQEREPCYGKDLGERLDPYVEPVLPEVDKGIDPVVSAKALPWEEVGWIDTPPITAEVVTQVMGREAKTSHPDREPLQRWILLSSEPFQCLIELRKAEPRAGVDMALAEWREFNQPTAEEKRAMRRHEREMARIARKGQDVDTKEETLSDEMQPELDEEAAIAAEEAAGEEIDISELLGDDDPAPDPEPAEEGEAEEERPMPRDVESDEDEFKLDDDF